MFVAIGPVALVLMTQAEEAVEAVEERVGITVDAQHLVHGAARLRAEDPRLGRRRPLRHADDTCDVDLLRLDDALVKLAELD